MRLWSFYDTPEHRPDLERRMVEGREASGTGWGRGVFAGTVLAHGFDWEFIEENEGLHSARDCFDALLTRRAAR